MYHTNPIINVLLAYPKLVKNIDRLCFKSLIKIQDVFLTKILKQVQDDGSTFIGLSIKTG